MTIVTIVLTGIVAYVFGKLRAEHEIRYTRTYEERATVVAHLYKLVVEAETSIKNYSYPFGTGEEEERKDVANRFMALQNYYLINAIWLDQNVCTTLDFLLQDVRFLLHDMHALNDQNITRREMNLPSDPSERAKIREGIVDRALTKIPSTRQQLRDEFKELLRVVDRSPKATRPLARFYMFWTS